MAMFILILMIVLSINQQFDVSFYLVQRLLDVLTELEKLKPVVRQRIDELNPKLTPRYNVQAHPANGSLGWSTAVKPSFNSYDHTKVCLMLYSCLSHIPCIHINLHCSLLLILKLLVSFSKRTLLDEILSCSR